MSEKTFQFELLYVVIYYMYIAFASVRNKYKEAMNMLLNSLPYSWRTRYIVVYQNEPHESIREFEDGHFEVSIRQNMFEYGTWIGVQLLIDKGYLIKDTWFLFIHDTCKFCSSRQVQPIARLIQYYEETNVDIIWMCNTGQCNFCLIRRIGIRYGSFLYSKFQTIPKHDAIDWEHSHNNVYSPKSFPVHQVFTNMANQTMPKRQIYSNVIRDVLYYPSLDLEKYYVRVNHEEVHPSIP